MNVNSVFIKRQTMKLEITINMDNAAFGDTNEERSKECSLILERLAAKMQLYGFCVGDSLKDTNGHTMGAVRLIWD